MHISLTHGLVPTFFVFTRLTLNLETSVRTVQTMKCLMKCLMRSGDKATEGKGVGLDGWSSMHTCMHACMNTCLCFLFSLCSAVLNICNNLLILLFVFKQ